MAIQLIVCNGLLFGKSRVSIRFIASTVLIIGNVETALSGESYGLLWSCWKKCIPVRHFHHTEDIPSAGLQIYHNIVLYITVVQWKGVSARQVHSWSSRMCYSR